MECRPSSTTSERPTCSRSRPAGSSATDGVVEAPRSAGGDSFSWYLERTGGTYARLGTHAGDDDRLDLHAGTFDVDETAIGIGIATLIHVVLDELA